MIAQQAEALEIAVNDESGIVVVRQRVREHASKLGLSLVSQTKIVTAASELTRNIIKYAGKGQVTIQSVTDSLRSGLKLIFKDQGPGIADIGQAMQDGYSTGHGLGLGLSGSKRLVDYFHIDSIVGQGTEIQIILWK